MPTAKELIAIAEAQVGYKEKASNSQLDSKTANAGSINYQKYGRDLYNAGYYNGNKNGYEWCDQFVDWCFWELCGHDKKKAEAMECQTGLLGAGCTWSMGYYKNAGRFSTEPQLGDQIFFRYSGSPIGDADHTGIVVNVDKNYVYTVEGNCGNQVARCTYARKTSVIAGYGHPKFDAEPAAQTTVKPAPAPAPVPAPAKTPNVPAGPTLSDRVKEAQKWLNSYGAYKLDVDGEWGPLTNAACIKALQKNIGVDADGIIGPITRGAIKVLRNGSFGNAVKILQCFLIKQGYTDIDIDGEFGPLTEAAVKKFQAKAKIEVDGEAGKDTFTELAK